MPALIDQFKDKFTEFQEVVQVFEVDSAKWGHIRLEVMKDHKTSTPKTPFSVNYYQRAMLKAKPEVGFEHTASIWIVADGFPWVKEETAEKALAKALSWVLKNK